MALKSLLHVVARQILGRMTSNGGIIIIEETLDVQVLGDGQTSSFGVVTLCKDACMSRRK